MRRVDLLATIFTVPFALLATRSTSASEFENFGGRNVTLRNVRAGFVNALDYGLRSGGGHGEHNAIACSAPSTMWPSSVGRY